MLSGKSLFPRWKMTRWNRSNAGFTLIEVMVALSVAALGLVAVSAALSRSVDTVDRLEQSSYATWISSNRFAELRMSRAFQSTGSASSTVEFAGRAWQVVENYFTTADPNIARVEVQVYLGEEQFPVHTDTGYLARYEQRP